MTALQRRHWLGRSAADRMADEDARASSARISALAAAALGYEILLTRLFSIIAWHHFAYMMISVALLGYGAAGTFVALAQRRLLPRFDGVFAAGAALFGATAVAGGVDEGDDVTEYELDEFNIEERRELTEMLKTGGGAIVTVPTLTVSSGDFL